MPIIKDKQITENTWTYISDGQQVVDGNITVSLPRWLQEREQLKQHDGKVGIRLSSTDQTELLSQDMDSIGLIELVFHHFADGRMFSQARLLRSRLGYKGELRAVGNYLPDQVFYLHRVGVNSFEFADPKDIKVAVAALDDFSVTYQAAIN